MSDHPVFSVIIVSYQVRDLLRRCLRALTAQHDVDLEIRVVDNASSDGSADMVAREFPAVHLMRSPVNLGFARANNLALVEAGGDFLALINPDTELPEEALRVVTEVFARHPRAGAVGLALREPGGTPQPACHSFPGLMNLMIEMLGVRRLFLPLGIGTPTAAPPPAGGEGCVDWVAGACMVISKAAYHEVGGLNHELFMYGEEMDWSWRARQRGLQTVYSDAVQVVHHGGGSGEGVRGELFVFNIESRLAFLRRFRGRWRAEIAREIMVLGGAGRWVYWKLRARSAGRDTPLAARARLQLERFQAVLQWRFRGNA